MNTTDTQNLPDTAKALIALSQSGFNQFDLETFETKDELKSLFEQACMSHLKSGIQMGFYAIELKKMVGHGEFQDILSSVGLEARTAQNYMKIANTVLGLVKNEKISFLEEPEVIDAEVIEKEANSRSAFTLEQFSQQKPSKQIALSNLSTQMLLELDAQTWEAIEQQSVAETKAYVKGFKGIKQLRSRMDALEAENNTLKRTIRQKDEREKTLSRVGFYRVQTAVLEQSTLQNAHEFYQLFYDLSQDKVNDRLSLEWAQSANTLYTSLSASIAHLSLIKKRMDAFLTDQADIGLDAAQLISKTPDVMNEEEASVFLEKFNYMIRNQVIAGQARKDMTAYYPRQDADVKTPWSQTR